MEALRQDAHLAQPHVPFGGLRAEQFPDDVAQGSLERFDALPHDFRQEARGVCQLVADNLEVAGFRVNDPVHQRKDTPTEPLFSRGSGADSSVGGVRLQRALERQSPCLDVERLLVAEVVVDGRDVGAGLLADLRDGCVAEALLSEGPASDIEELRARSAAWFVCRSG
jgi:hypothetical protein